MIEKLYEEIAKRKKIPKEDSYTTYLFNQGTDKILKKIGEEATEVVIAAKNNQTELIAETSDLIYHLLVLLVEQEISLDLIEDELKKREGKLSNVGGRKNIHKL
ncbi:phosphoribosyl-ATP diphosphatase [Candidatus Enterococcus mansonii]|uniref:Phosphoribosyl-ATP pyrophosphatase n=1 Tax=Candidatus Enterococcus mansonii TaxID=1834181 RepID=A0A242CHI3_9ENTE|nr:phosphoribosyl-ATP diphosphatase [Enterococcus sp. 4G2_DIV0659]OTO09703.1 phosphoribosyl-ATP diphosphatase [Enterococcus sp. 4G2_DIV0659]